MTQRSENNLTEIMERVAQTFYAQQYGGQGFVEWEELSAVAKQEIKGNLLPMMMAVLDAVDEVEADTVKLQPTSMGYIASVWPVYETPRVPFDLLDLPVGDDTRSSWNWLRLANGDLMIGIFPCGDTYLELSDGAAEQDWKKAQAKNMWSEVSTELEHIYPEALERGN